MTHPWPTGSCGRGGEACCDVTAPIPLIVKQGRDPNKDMDQLSRYRALQVSRLPTESSLLVAVPVGLQISIQPRSEESVNLINLCKSLPTDYRKEANVSPALEAIIFYDTKLIEGLQEAVHSSIRRLVFGWGGRGYQID